MEVRICQLCKEPIANFACIRHMGEGIAQWLPSPTRELFEKENARFLDTFSYMHMDSGRHALSRSGGEPVCIYCYVNEVFQWLSGMDKAIAKRFRRMFSFGMKKEDFREIIISHADPITEGMPDMSEFGVCDGCGEYSEELSKTREGWVCEGCRNE
jgi:hypothetical protein